MQQLINEIQMMQVQLTGVPYPDWELEQMSDRSIKDLYADLRARYDEDMADTRSMFLGRQRGDEAFDWNRFIADYELPF